MAHILSRLFGRQTTSKYQRIVEEINALESAMQALPDSAFPERTTALKEKVATGTSLEEILPEAFALVREAATRTLSKRHYDVQLIGGMVLHGGQIAEMKTGEGKTLVATLPTYLNALTGKGVHVVTVNDYLARRDATWMGQIYHFLGLSIGILNDLNKSYRYDPTHKELDNVRDELGNFQVVQEFLRSVSRKEAYDADITYGTNSQYGFDYLRDNLVGSAEQLVQRGHAYAIVDEVDSILIDESRTPLIISSPVEESESLYKTFTAIARQLQEGAHYSTDEKQHAITLTDEGITRAEQLLGISDIYTEKGIKYVHHLETAVRAHALYKKDKHYVVRDGKVVIVDPYTGRLQPGRRWSEGLHQAIEAKEGVVLEQETRSVASITYQNYFRFYKKLSGMTGTAKTSEEEFVKVYGLEVITVPTHRPSKRLDHQDLIFQTEKGKLEAIAKKVKELHAKGQPVLIGTVSIEKNELISAYLSRSGIPHEVLNAKNHEREGAITAQAGKKGSVVIATNMAGRGVDIILGGAPAEAAAQDEVRNLGGLFVIGTERHEARRIDNQLRGRSGRQGDPGETQFYVSLEDDLMRIFGSGRIKSMMGRFGIPEDQPLQSGLISGALESAQRKIEGLNFDARKHTLEYDNVIAHQREVVYGRRRAMVEGDTDHVRNAFYSLGDQSALEELAAKKIALVGEDAFWDVARRIILHTTDALWVEHIDTMEHLRQSVNLRAYGQREPLVEYKKEGLQRYKVMETQFKEQVLTLVEGIGTIAVSQK